MPAMVVAAPVLSRHETTPAPRALPFCRDDCAVSPVVQLLGLCRSLQSLVSFNSQGVSEGDSLHESLTFLPCLGHDHEGDCYRHAKQPHKEQFHRGSPTSD